MFKHRNQNKNQGKVKSGGPEANTHQPVKGFKTDKDSSNSSNSSVAVRRPEVTFPHKVKLILSPEFLSCVMMMHRYIKTVEWSGPIWYEEVQGSIGKGYKDLVLKIKHFYPMHIGSGSYTEYDMNQDTSIVDAYDANPALENLRMGHCHSHHNMGTFFSGTDMAELHDNAPGYDYYLSIIVNHAGDFMAKIAFVGKQKSDIIYLKGKDEEAKQMNNIDQEVLGVIDCDIIWDVPQYVKSRYNDLRTKNNSSQVTNHNYNPRSYESNSTPIGMVPSRPVDYTQGSSARNQFFPHYAKKFLSKLLMQSYGTEEDYDKILLRKNGMLYDYTKNRIDRDKLDEYTAKMAEVFPEYFEKYFGLENTTEGWAKICDLMINILGPHAKIDLAEELIDLFLVWREGPEDPQVEAPGSVDLDKEMEQKVNSYGSEDDDFFQF